MLARLKLCVFFALGCACMSAHVGQEWEAVQARRVAVLPLSAKSKNSKSINPALAGMLRNSLLEAVRRAGGYELVDEDKMDRVLKTHKRDVEQLGFQDGNLLRKLRNDLDTEFFVTSSLFAPNKKTVRVGCEFGSPAWGKIVFSKTSESSPEAFKKTCEEIEETIVFDATFGESDYRMTAPRILYKPPRPPAFSIFVPPGTRIMLDLTIGSDGLVKSVTPLECPEGLLAPAEDWGRRFRFSPATRGGVPIMGRFIVTFSTH